MGRFLSSSKEEDSIWMNKSSLTNQFSTDGVNSVIGLFSRLSCVLLELIAENGSNSLFWPEENAVQNAGSWDYMLGSCCDISENKLS